MLFKTPNSWNQSLISSLINMFQEPLIEFLEKNFRMLMCLTGNPNELQKKLPYLAPLVERMATIDGSLMKLNNQGKDALYLACMTCPRMAFVAGYLAATFLQKNIDIGRRLYQPKVDLGNYDFFVFLVFDVENS